MDFIEPYACEAGVFGADKLGFEVFVGIEPDVDALWSGWSIVEELF